jgi:NTE family protein
MPPKKPRREKVAFVLGGGGHMGAYEVGMLRALGESGIRPDLIVGTRGSTNGSTSTRLSSNAPRSISA